jgi:hypothetical protein
MLGEMLFLTDIFLKLKREEMQSLAATSGDVHREIRPKRGLCKLYQEMDLMSLIISDRSLL